MPTQSAPFPLIPNDTAHAAEAAFGKGNIYLTIGDQMEHLLAGVDLADLAAPMEKPTATLAMLALVTAFQYAENLPDRRAVEAIRTRTDWKYALHLPLDYLGFGHTALCEFRKQPLHDLAAQGAFQQMLDHLAEIGLWRNVDNQGKAAGALTAVCTLSRLERLVEAMRMTLEALATKYPEWLRSVALPHWYARYNQVLSTYLLPRSVKAQEELAQAIGTDAGYLLQKIGGGNTAFALMLPEVPSLMHEWQQQFDQSAGEARWRSFCVVCASANDSSSGSTQPA